MIPKIIHYTWFSGEPFPKKIQQCIDSWHQYMSDYEYILWDAERIKEIDSIWLDECLAKRKWAYAADLVRMYAVFRYGGIYLDTDCMVYKPFDSLLAEKCFIGKANSIHISGGRMESYLSSHCFGAEVGNEFISRCYHFYESRHFVLSEDETLPMNLKWNIILSPFVQSELAKQFGYNPFPSYKAIQNLSCLTIYPKFFFDTIKVSSESYCKHLALGSWREEHAPVERVTFGYKIRWRIEAIVQKILGTCGYMMIKMM